MSVRIYQLSKELDMENKELIQLLCDRGYNVSSASNTISNIDAEALVAEFKSKTKKAAAEPEKAEEKEAEAPAKKAFKPKLPLNKFVKSAKEVEESKTPPPSTAKKVAKKAAEPTPTAATPPSAPPPTPSTPPQAPTPPTPSAPPAAAAPPPVPASTSVPVPPPISDEPTEAKEDDGELKMITLKPPIIVRDFAKEIGLKPFRLISELMEIGIFASMNQTIDEEVALKVAETHGFLLEIKHRGESQAEPQKKPVEEKPKVDESKFLEPRPPIVCVLGHVDHGKTTLLDSIRKANVVSGEAGGITQHIGAYQVTQNDQKISFIDTPGHAAFSKMRERGANITDIAILVVAADDGFMPQTDEALKFAQKANVPVVVAINKIDTKGANIDKVKQQMQQRNIAPEDWGGEVLSAPVAAIQGDGIPELLENILLQAEVLELKANPKCPAEGVVIESQIEAGRGPTATVIIEKGTLKVGDALVCGSAYCKVRGMFDDKGERLKSAPPSTPASVLGWSQAPEAGTQIKVVKNEREAKKQAETHELERKRAAQQSNTTEVSTSIDDLLGAIASAQTKALKVVVKGDVHGSVEALVACLEAIESDKIDLDVIDFDVGQISKNDVAMASASEATIIGFNVKMENGVTALAKHHDVRIIQHNIIYELIDSVKECMAELLEPERHENKLGQAEVRQVFPVSKGAVAGCMVTEGRIVRDSHARILRNGENVYQGIVSTLKRFKDDSNEVRAGYECGIRLNQYNSYKDGDIIECFEIKEVLPSL